MPFKGRINENSRPIKLLRADLNRSPRLDPSKFFAILSAIV